MGNNINSLNLNNTYMRGRPKDRDFYNAYKNYDNTIDDPIFTGFTFDIDTIHSPLFYVGNNDVYLNMKSSDGSNTNISSVIEKNIENIYKLKVNALPDSYELDNIYVKEQINQGSTYRAGYGLQEYMLIDKVMYGAIDYIYMVDKISTGRFNNSDGVSDIGNGTPTKSVYDEYNDSVASAKDYVYENINRYNWIGSDSKNFYDEDNLTNTIEDLKNTLSEKEDEHNENKAAYESAKKAYEELLNDSKEIESEINQIKNNISDQNIEVENKLTEFKELMSEKLKDLKSNLTDTSIKQEIENIYTKFSNFVSSIKDTYSSIDTTITVGENFDDDEQELNESEKTVLDYFKKIWTVIKTKITGKNRTDSTQTKLTELNNKLKTIEIKLYGKENGSISDYTKNDSCLYYKYQKTKTEYQEDEYSKTQQEIEKYREAFDNYEDIQKYNEYQSTKVSTESLLPSVDNNTNETNDTVNSMNENRQTYEELPQTVYDMIGFVSGMKNLTNEYPYIMQTVSGLDEAYKKYFLMKEPYQGSGDDKITIECFESLDLRVTSMFNKYFNAVYDHQYKRERVPVNLRRFNCSIFVHDIRNFRHALSNINTSNVNFIEHSDGDNAISKITELALNYISVVEFKFFDCEIIQEETGSIFDNVSNESAGDMRTTKFTFKYGNCVINFLPYEDLKQYTSSNDVLDDTNGTLRINNNLDGNSRRWFDKSELGNVNNNDYRESVQRSSSVSVDNYYRTSSVNSFAMNSVVNKNKELTNMNNVLKRLMEGVSASTGIPTKDAADALNIGNVYEYVYGKNRTAGNDIKNIGSIDKQVNEHDIISDLGKI